MLFSEFLVKVAHIEIDVLLLIKAQDFFDGFYGDALGRGLSTSAVEESIITMLLVALSPAAHLAATNADDLGSLPPGNLLGQRAQDNFLNFHHPLHGGL